MQGANIKSGLNPESLLFNELGEVDSEALVSNNSIGFRVSVAVKAHLAEFRQLDHVIANGAAEIIVGDVDIAEAHQLEEARWKIPDIKKNERISQVGGPAVYEET